MIATAQKIPPHHQYWWMVLLRGIVAVLFGLLAMLWPGLTTIILVYLFGTFALFDGALAIVIAILERAHISRWWVLLLEGIFGLLIALLAYLSPVVTALVLLYLVAAWAIVTGIIELVAAFTRKYDRDLEWTLAIAGILSILLGILLVLQPINGLLTIVWVIGIYAIFSGLLLIISALSRRPTRLAA
jgi:uncharacterized membrane protein HdeD (DUF308 family)